MAFIPRFIDNKVNIDYTRCKDVAVITTFTPSGKLKPLYFLVTDMYGNDCKTKVDGIKYTKDGNGCITFCSTYQVGNRERECLLTYYIQDHFWVLEN